MPITDADLRAAATKVIDLGEAVAERDALIVAALGQGYTQRQVALLTWLSAGRVGQIASANKNSPGTSGDDVRGPA